MTNPVHEITDVPPTTSKRKKIAAGVAIGMFAAGVILLIDDRIKKMSRNDETSDTTES